MGELIMGDFDRTTGCTAFGCSPDDEPGLYALSPEELVKAAIQRELDLKSAAAQLCVDKEDDAAFRTAMAASLRVSSLLSPEQSVFVAVTAREMYDNNW